MAATSIGSTGNHPYPLAKMPELTDPADIQVALRNYHYGQNGVLAGGADATAGIAYYLKEIESDIADLVTADATVVSKTIVDLKGDLIVGSAADTVVRLPAGSAGYLLSTDINETSGLKWIAPPQSATTSVVGIVQLSDSTSETSSIKAATPTAVKAAYDKASTAATTSVVGVVQLSDSTSETSSIKAATPTAVKAAYDKASTAATTSVVGIVQLSDSTSETSSIKAATPTAVKAAYDKASTAATTSIVGIVQLSDSTSETSSIKAATPTAVKAAYDKASTAATTSVVGIVQLSDSTSETSSIKAATPTAVSTLKQTVDSSTKTASYELDPADAGKIIIMNASSGSAVITIPLETTFPAGARVDILQIGSVQTSVAPISGSVTLNSKNNNRKLSGQYSAATLIKVGTNSWVLLGDLTA